MYLTRMAEPVQTLLQLHLDELHRGYIEASQRGLEALSAGDLDGFVEAIQQKRAIHDEWLAVLENYFDNHVRHYLNRRTSASQWKRPMSATRR